VLDFRVRVNLYTAAVERPHEQLQGDAAEDQHRSENQQGNLRHLNHDIKKSYH